MFAANTIREGLESGRFQSWPSWSWPMLVAHGEESWTPQRLPPAIRYPNLRVLRSQEHRSFSGAWTSIRRKQ